MRVTMVLLVHQEMGRDVGSGASVGSGVSIGVSVGAGDSVKTGDSVGKIVSVSTRVSVADGVSMGVVAAELEDRDKLEFEDWVGAKLGVDTISELAVKFCTELTDGMTISVLVGISMLVYELEFELSAEVTEPFEFELELGSSMDDAMETFCVWLATELWHETYTVPDVEEIDVDTVTTLVFQKVGITAGQEGGMFKDVVRGWDVRLVEDGSGRGVGRGDTVVDSELDTVGAPD